MKYITDYKEFDEEANISLLDSISDAPIVEKDKVLKYLKNGNDAGVRCSAVHDIVGNFSTGETIHRYTDGEFVWDSSEIYHFEHYNIKLNEEFINKVLEE